MKSRIVATTAVVALLCSTGVNAHHSFAQQYDAEQPITLTGIVMEVSWQNPHSHIYVETKDDTGKVARWAVEGYPPAALRRQGFARELVKAGDTVTVTGWRARATESRMAALTVTLADGRKLTFGPMP